MSNCIFCKIVKGEAPADILYSDEQVMAFLDIRPLNPGHTLIIPKKHAKDLSELDPRTGGQIFKTAMILDNALRNSGLRCEGVDLFLADGEAAFQEILHVHLHMIPRFEGDGFRMKFSSNYDRRPEKKESEAIASQIIRAIKRTAQKP